MAIPAARTITSEERRELLALERDDIDDKLLKDYFACRFGQKKPKFNTYDKFKLPAGRLGNEQEIETTVGRYIVNLYIFPEKYLEKFGYVNQPLTKKALKKIEDQMGKMILNDEITTKEYLKYLDGGEWLGMNVVYYLGPTMGYDINVPIPEVIKLRDELFDKYSEEIKKGDSAVADKIEKEVLDLAKKKIKESGNEAYDFFESGIGAFENNYKKTSIMGGAIQNPYTKKLDIIKSNYTDGVSPKDYPKMASLSLTGGYSRGVETQVSGYERKKLDNALQGVLLDEPESDCGTKFTLRVKIPGKMKDLFLYRYIKEGDKLVELTDSNIDKYADKEVELRTPMFCKGDCICNKCAGNLYYKMNIKEVGLLNDAMARCTYERCHEKIVCHFVFIK